jgi:hypothetical protein
MTRQSDLATEVVRLQTLLAVEGMIADIEREAVDAATELVARLLCCLTDAGLIVRESPTGPEPGETIRYAYMRPQLPIALPTDEAVALADAIDAARVWLDERHEMRDGSL